MKQILFCKIRPVLLFLKLFLSLSVTAQQQLMRLPDFTDVAGTQLTNTNGQWVRIDPAQPNNIDLIETRIFKMPQKNTGVLAVEFRLVGADGGTARYQWGLNNRFSLGGGGGQVQFTLDLSKTQFYDDSPQTYNPPGYGRPFLVTFGKKGESKTIGQGFYCSAGGGGSTGMAWLVPNVLPVFLNETHMVAAAGGGSGGFSFVFGTLNGNSASRNAVTSPGNSEGAYIKDIAASYGDRIHLWIVAGGSTLMQSVIPSACCDNSAKMLAASGLVYSKAEYQTSVTAGNNGKILTSLTFGQGGGQPTTVFMSAAGTPNITGLGQVGFYEMIQLGGKGGAGFGGGGAGSSTTTWRLGGTTADGIPTSGAGGTGSLKNYSLAHEYPDIGEAGWNYYHNHTSILYNVSVSSRALTDNPQSGYIMYRTIMDAEAPVIIPDRTITLNIGNGKAHPNYSPDAPLTMEMLESHIGAGQIISDNDGVKSITFSPAQLRCSDVGETVPVSVTVTDFAGNTTSGLIYVNVTDNFAPVRRDLFERSPDLWDPEAHLRINVTSGSYTLTAANFPEGYDGCKGSNVRVNFPPTTFTCRDAGDQPVTYYYIDSDGNRSPDYVKTFKVVYAETPKLYVDASATGANNGSSWADAFRNLQDALTYGCTGSTSTREIYVAQGTYYPDRGVGITRDDRSASFALKDNFKLYGGFPAGGADYAGRNPEAHPTLLSGGINSGAANDNSYHVVSITGNNTHLEGFTIREGYADNNPGIGGGGLIIMQMENQMAAPHSSTIRHCKFLNNYGTYGGAVYSHYNNSLFYNYLGFQNCLFERNTASIHGGAVYLSNDPGITTMQQEFVNCLFNNNTAAANGGAFYTKEKGNVKAVNCTFGYNTAGSAGGAIYNQGTVKLHNSIVYFNSAQQINNSGTLEIDYSNIQGSGGSAGWSLSGVTDSGNNIDSDPLFHTSPALSLLKDSPCRNAGLNTYNNEPKDIYGGNLRISQEVIDMGAFEVNSIVYVAADAPAGGDGNSWATALNNLSDGIAAAGTGATQRDVWVKAGTYRPDRLPGRSEITPHNRENSFYINYRLKVYGGFAGTESSVLQRNIGQHPTILSGDLGIVGLPGDNAYHVITMMSGAAHLDGFIVEGGFADHPTNADHQNGGGIMEYGDFGDANNVIANCVFRNNYAAGKGGAAYLRANRTGVTNFVQTLFYANRASRAAVSFVEIADRLRAFSYDQNFYHVTVYGNLSDVSGAGVFEAAQMTGEHPARMNFYNSVLAGNAPLNYNDVTNPGNITLINTYTGASGTNVFVSTSNITGADGKIMTADDGLNLRPSSPAINYGDNTQIYEGIEKDVTGGNRIQKGIVDAGAYESAYSPTETDANGIIYVRKNATGRGRSWADATGDLHNAILAAGVQKVFVAIGNYPVGDNSFIMKNDVAVYGGFDPDNGITDLSHPRIMPDPAKYVNGSVLDGQNVRPVIWNVFTSATALNNSAVLDGFMITKGTHFHGGGVRNVYASPILRNVMVTGNTATISGAGIYNDHSSPLLTNAVIGSNFIVNADLNAAINGAGISNMSSSAPILTNVTLAGNQLIAPLGTGKGAGLYSSNSSPEIYNSIIWNNRIMNLSAIPGADLEKEGSGTLILKNSITQGYTTGVGSDNNKVNTNPAFEDETTGNYRLGGISPAIDAGSNVLYAGLNNSTRDLAGNSRVYNFAGNKAVDMGAYEYPCARVDYGSIIFENTTVTYNGSPQQISVQNLPQDVSVSYEIRNSDDVTTSGNVATHAGIYTITAIIMPSGSPGDCVPLVKTATLTINKAPAIISTNNVQEFVYDGAVKNVVASLNHTEAALDYSPQAEYTDAGVYWITVSSPETANYLAASEMVSLVIENADFTGVTLNDASFSYDGTVKSLTISGTLPAGATVVYAGNEKTDAGIYAVSALIQMPYYNDLWLTSTLTINKAVAIITTQQTQKHVYDGTVKNVTASLNHSDTTLTYTPQRGYSAVGTYPIIISTGETGNYLAASETVSLVIESASHLGITFRDSTFTYDGTPKSLAVSGLPQDATVTYTGNGKTNAGIYSVSATIKRQNYQDTTLSATLTINKAAAVITAVQTQKHVYDGTVKNVAASLNHSETTLSYAPQRGYSAVGTYPVIVSSGETGNYLAASETVSLVIESASLSGITFRDSTFTYDGTPKSLAVSGLPQDATVTYTGNGKTNAGIYSVSATIKRQNYQDSTLSATLTINKAATIITAVQTQKHVYDGTVKNVVASLNHSEITLTYAPQRGYSVVGTYPIIISAGETSNYLAASSTVSLVIESASLSGITFRDSTFTYDGTAKSLVVNGLPTNATVIYSDNGKINVGVYSIKATVSHPNYRDSLFTATLTIHKAAAVITAAQTQNHIYDGAVKNVEATLNHTETSLTYAPQQGYSATGTYPVTVSAAASPNYLAVSYTVNLVIEKANLSGIILRDSTFTYDGTPKSLAVSGLPTNATVIYSGNGKTNAGIYSVSATVSRPNYQDSVLTATLIINKAAATITAPQTQRHVYDGAVKNVIASLNHTETTLSYSPQQGYTTVGTYPVIISAAETSNYLKVADTVSLVIEGASHSGITFRDSTFTYDGTPKSLAVSGLPQDATVTYTGNGKTNAGIYSVSATIKRQNYQDSTLSATLTINKATAVITAFQIQKHVYDGTVKNVVASLNHSETTLTYAPQRGYSAVGTYPVIVSSGETGNYLAASATVSLVIESASHSGITFRDSTFTYDGTPKSLAVSGLPQDATVTYTGNGKTNAGIYSVSATIKRQNYQDSTLSATLTINKAVAVITAVQTQKHVYDGTVKNVAASLNHSEITLTYTPQRGYSAVGTYPIIISAGETGNYLAASETVSLVIESASHSGITFRDSTFTYDGTPKSLVVSGLPQDATVTYTGNGKTNAGIYSVSATIKRQNYQDSTLLATLTINKATAVITAVQTQKHVYDGTVKNVVASLNHSETTLTYAPQRGYSAVGTYPVIVSSGETGNYLAASATVSLVIESASHSGITFRDSTFTYDGTPKSLAVSGLPQDATVTYTGNGKTNAGIYSVSATIKRQNYQDSTLSATLTINKATAVITAVQTQKHVYDGAIKNVMASLNHTETTLTYFPQRGYSAVGVYPVIVSVVETTNYLKTADTVSLVIEKASLETITFKDSTFTYDGTPKSLAISGTIPVGVKVTYTGNAKTDAGTYTVSAKVSLEHYKDSTFSAVLKIHKAAAVITAAAEQMHTVDGSLKNVVASLNHKEVPLSYAPQQGYTQPGIYEITVSAPESKNYLAVTQKVKLVINKATFQGVSFSGGEFTYNGSAHFIYVWGTPEDTRITYFGNGQTDAGTYTVKALIQKENYHDLELTANMIIHKAQAYISAEAFQSHVYDGSVKSVQAWLNHSETPLLYYPQQGYIDAGSYPVNVIANESRNYLSTSASVHLYIDKARFQGVSFPGKEFTYNGSPHSLSVAGAPDGATVTYTGNHQINAGIYKVTALVQMKNYYDLELEAELLIHKAPQQIFFEEIGLKHLENDSDFQLYASSSSGLPVSYSYTYDAELPPATVTEEGWVELHTSGYVKISAHQGGNENYLPAESVTRQLKINSSDATLHRITIGESSFETPETEIYYLIDCADEADRLPIQLKTEVGAYVVPGRSFIIEIPKPGIYKQTIVITSQDSTNTLTYHITVEKRFNFEDIGVQKFNNLFLVNNNPETNGGYEFTDYEWYKNEELVGSGQYYSAGNQVNDILDGQAIYAVRMKTKAGEWLSSCTFSFRPDESFTIGIFPNPVLEGGLLKVKVNHPGEAKVRILTLTGIQVLEVFLKGNPAEIKLPSGIPAGSYILHYDDGRYRKSIPFVLEK